MPAAIAAFLSELNPGDPQPPAVHVLEAEDLYNTGLSASFEELESGADDPHYAVVAGPAGSGSDWVGCSSSSWVDCQGTEPDSQWLTLNSLPGQLTIRTTFTILPEAVLSSVVLSGRWSSQNATLDIRVNGVSTGQTSPANGADVWHALEVDQADFPGAFAHGVNTLDFVVDNEAVVAGLRTDDLAVEALPEPSAVSGFAWALPVLVLLHRRRRHS